MSQLANFKEGVLGSVFDSLDRVQHMFFRDRPDVIEKWYARLDAIVGRVEAFLKKEAPALPKIRYLLRFFRSSNHLVFLAW